MTKIRYLQIAIFQKNIISKMDENGLKYMSRTNFPFDIGLGWLVHENFFTAAKLRFLIPLGLLLGYKELQTRCCPEWPQVILEHFRWVYYMIICQVGPLWGHLGTPGGPKTAPKLTYNGPKSSEWHCMTPNGPSCPNTVLRGIIYDYMQY